MDKEEKNKRPFARKAIDMAPMAGVGGFIGYGKGHGESFIERKLKPIIKNPDTRKGLGRGISGAAAGYATALVMSDLLDKLKNKARGQEKSAASISAPISNMIRDKEREAEKRKSPSAIPWAASRALTETGADIAGVYGGMQAIDKIKQLKGFKSKAKGVAALTGVLGAANFGKGYLEKAIEQKLKARGEQKSMQKKADVTTQIEILFAKIAMGMGAGGGAAAGGGGSGGLSSGNVASLRGPQVGSSGSLNKVLRKKHKKGGK